MVKLKSHIKSAGLFPEGGGVDGRLLEINQTDEFEEDQSEEIEMGARLIHHENIEHAYKIDASEEHAIIQAFRHTKDELKK